MAKKAKTTLVHYEGLKRDKPGQGWKVVGYYKTWQEAKDDGCQKAKPRYVRN